MKAVRMLKTQAGFSLIELMIVVAIIGILASIAVPNFQKFQRKSKQTEGKGYLASIYAAEKSFQAEWSNFSSDMNCIGFNIDGRGVYGAGINLATAVIAGTTCGNAAASNFRLPTAPTGVGLPAVGNLDAAAIVASTTNFTAGATGNIHGDAAYTDANADKWIIDDAKLVTNKQSGI